MPGANEHLDMFAKRHNVPLEAALGGSATLYPEYAARLRSNGNATATQPSAGRSQRPPQPAEAAVAGGDLSARRGAGLARLGRRP